MRLFSVGMLTVIAAGAALGQPEDSSWISYYNGADGWFAFQGPQRAMILDPADFGLSCPLQVESLKTWWYWGMGSRQDTVFTFRIYGRDGRSLLWESESLVAPVSNWTYYGLRQPVVIDSGSFYIATTHRLVNPYAHPYVNVDTGPTNHSYFGSPGAWQLDNVGEFCFFAFVGEVSTGTGEARWTPVSPAPGSIVRARPFDPANTGGRLLDATGTQIALLRPGATRLRDLAPGVYFIHRSGSAGTSRIVVVK